MQIQDHDDFSRSLTIVSPPAQRDSIDDRSAARSPGARPGRALLIMNLAKIRTALLGQITRASTVPDPEIHAGRYRRPSC
jgi:hypothetical protein